MATQQEVIKAFMDSLDTTTASGVDALNAAVKNCSGFGGVQEVIDKLISDVQSAASAEEFLKDKCGIDLGNTDTGAITGADAGGSKIKTAKSIVPETAKAKYPSGTSFTKRGLTVVVPSKKTLTADQQTVVQGLYSWWIDGALKLIAESYGYKFSDKDATAKKITVEFEENPSSDALASVTGNFVSKNGGASTAKNLTLTINMSHFQNLSADNVDGKVGENYLDRSIAHELTHAIMMSKIDDFKELPLFVAEGMAELTHGIDDTRGNEILSLAGDSSALKNLLEVEKISGEGDGEYSAGYIFLRYLAKQAEAGVSSGGDDDDATWINDDNTKISAGGVYKITPDFSGTITIDTTEPVTIDGGDAGQLINVCIKTTAKTADLTIKNFNVHYDERASQTILFGSGKGNKLTLEGRNSLTNFPEEYFPLQQVKLTATINIGGGLTIDGTGSLKVKVKNSGASIGTDYAEKSSANLTINGGKISTYTVNNSAGIGCGYEGTIGDITINGGEISGGIIGCGSEGSAGDILITGGKISTRIGVGKNGSVGNIHITGNANIISGDGAGTAAIGGYYALGTGKDSLEGVHNSVGDIKIDGNAKVIARTDGTYIATASTAQPNWSTYNPHAVGIGAGVIGDSKSSSTVGKITVGGKSLVLLDNYFDDIKFKAGTKTFSGNYILLKNGKQVKAASSGTNGDDFLNNYKINASTVSGGKGDDNISNVAGKYVSIDGGDGNDIIWNYSGNNSTIDGGAGDDIIENESGEYSIVLGGDGNDTIINKTLHTTISGGKGDDLIELRKGVYQYSSGDGNDTLVGYFSGSDLQIDGKYKVSRNSRDILITVGKGSILLQDYLDDSIIINGKNVTVKSDELVQTEGKVITGTEKRDRIVLGGDNFIVNGNGGNDSILSEDFSNLTINGGDGNDLVLVDNSSEDIANIKIDGGNGNDDILNVGENSTVIGGAGEDIIENYGEKSTLLGGDGDDDISNVAGKYVSIDGGNGDDWLGNYEDDVTILGGAGNDSIANFGGEKIFVVYNSGDGIDTIFGFDATSTLSIGGEFSTVKSGNDLIVSVGDGSILLQDVGNFKPKIIGGEETSETLTLTNKDKSSVTIGAAVEIVDASARTKSVKIFGNALANSLVGGTKGDSIHGGAGDDTISGGLGNDKLWGDDGADKFIYADGDGKDIIHEFGEDDLLEITGDWSAKFNKSKNTIAFKVGKTSNAITLTDFTATTFNVNGDSYQISGSKLVK